MFPSLFFSFSSSLFSFSTVLLCVSSMNFMAFLDVKCQLGTFLLLLLVVVCFSFAGILIRSFSLSLPLVLE